VDKCYRALLDSELTEKDVQAFAAGLDLGDFTAQPAQLTILNPKLAEVVISEGKFHQVKRMFEKTGHQVLALHRSSFGPLTLSPDLQEGQWRELTDGEIKALRAAAGMEKEEA
jgi:16S rRNA pseudouridine516 synthase